MDFVLQNGAFFQKPWNRDKKPMLTSLFTIVTLFHAGVEQRWNKTGHRTVVNPFDGAPCGNFAAKIAKTRNGM